MRLGLPDFVSNSYFPAIAAVEMGFFKAEGLDMELELVFPVPKCLETMRDGGLDFVAASSHATLTAFPNWQGAKLLAALARHMYWFLVLRTDLGAKRGDIEAVKGLRIGAAPGVDLGLKRMLTAAGLDPEANNIQIQPVPGATAAGVSFGVTAAKALSEGAIDGFWANGMGAEVAVRSGAGTVVLDIRRGEGPAEARGYTFPALVTTDRLIADNPDAAAAAVRALVKTQRALAEDPQRAAEVGKALYPPEEAGLIATLIERDVPYYDPRVPEPVVASMNQFARDIGLLTGPVAYEDVVAVQFSHLWEGP
jgi:ABC-type nitrate/sulfonate/bicarbonate transport system substrate-binding protein